MPKVKLEYKGSVTPKATSFLKPHAIDMHVEVEYDVPASDAAHAGLLQKEFQKAMQDGVERQLAGLNQWLKERDTILEKLVKGIEALRGSFPADQAQAHAFSQQAEVLRQMADKAQSLEKDYLELVNDWAGHCKGQQANVALVVALKNARMSALESKRFKVIGGGIGQAAWTIAPVALAAITLALSAGPLAPAVLAVLATIVALRGVNALYQGGKQIASHSSVEKKLLADLNKDVEAIRSALAATHDSHSRIVRHASDLENLIAVRTDQLHGLENQFNQIVPQMHRLEKELHALRARPEAAVLLDASAIQKHEKALATTKTHLHELHQLSAAAKADIDGWQAVAREVQALGVDLGKVAEAAPGSILEKLKARAGSADDWLKMAERAAKLAQAISEAH